MLNDLIGFTWMFGFAPYSEAWRGLIPSSQVGARLNPCPERRRTFQRAFHPSNINTYRPQLLNATRRFLLHLLDDPEHFRDHVRLYVFLAL